LLAGFESRFVALEVDFEFFFVSFYLSDFLRQHLKIIKYIFSNKIQRSLFN